MSPSIARPWLQLRATTRCAISLLLLSAVASGATGCEGPTDGGDPDARVVVRGTVRDAGLRPVVGATVFAAFYPSNACGVGERLGWKRAVGDGAGRYAVTLRALRTDFVACVEVTADTLSATASLASRLRGVRFREQAPTDTQVVDVSIGAQP